MDCDSLEQRLQHITTLWAVVRQAHGPAPDTAGAARRALLERYSGAAYRYLLGALRNADAADELFQEFSLRLLRGDFRNASSEGGHRFRDFVKTALFHLIVDHQKRQRARPRALTAAVNEPAVWPPEQTDAERAFNESWREELMDRTWLALAELGRQTGQSHFTVLRFRTENPLLSSADLAEQLGPRLGKALTIDAVRKALQRAREQFTALLVAEVAHYLDNPSADQLEQELLDLGLLAYCRPTLDRRRRGR